AASLLVCRLMLTTRYRNPWMMRPIPARPMPSTTCRRTHTHQASSRHFQVSTIVIGLPRMPSMIFHLREDQVDGGTTYLESGAGAQSSWFRAALRSPSTYPQPKTFRILV